MTRQFTKTVHVVEKDDDERIATSAVLVPNEVDLQLDWFRPEDIERSFNPDADIGVMHSVFPDGAAESEHFILDEPETYGGTEFPAGTWMERRHYEDDDLWQFVKDGILAGRSIGGTVPDDAEEVYSPGELPNDVSYGDGVPTGHATTRITNADIFEVSDVDTPAVPAAQHAVVKSLGKNIMAEVSGVEEFVAVMAERGHSEDDARRLWSYMQGVSKSKNTLDPDVHDCKESILEDNPEMSESEAIAICRAQLGKATSNESAESDTGLHDSGMTDETDTDDDEPTDKHLEDVDDATLGAKIKSALGLGKSSDNATDDDVSPESGPSEDAPTDDTAEKAGRTLSEKNAHYAMEIHDDAEIMLQDAGVDGHEGSVRTYDKSRRHDYERAGEHYKTAGSVGITSKNEIDVDEVAGHFEALRQTLLDTVEGYLGEETDEDPADHMEDLGGRITTVVESRVDELTDDDHDAGKESETAEDDADKSASSGDEPAESGATIFADIDAEKVDELTAKVENLN